MATQARHGKAETVAQEFRHPSQAQALQEQAAEAGEWARLLLPSAQEEQVAAEMAATQPQAQRGLLTQAAAVEAVGKE